MSVAVARWGVRIAPRLTSRLVAPKVRGTAVSAIDGGTLVVATGARAAVDHRTLIVVFSTQPRAMRWLAASLATRLAAAVVIADSVDDPATTLDRARAAVVPGLPVTIVGEDAGAAAALAASTTGVRRLALISPRSVGDVDTAGVPTTLIQDSESSAHRAQTVALERALRSGGVGVREPGYRTVTDGWARLPRVSSGTKRALDDLVQFVERGVGPTATFDVIPGWDLH